jgi:hypothetical protein
MRRPETCRLELTAGDWLVVKKWLTAGEARDVFARSVKTLRAGERAELEPRMLGITQAAAYLLEWSFQDADGQPIVIRDQPIEYVIDALNELDGPALGELLTAISEHDARMDAEREAEKKTPTAASAS